jgi:hypothetical protein
MRSLALTCSLIASLWLGGCGGCGDDGTVGHLPDARPVPDAPLDGMEPGGNPVTLTVLKDGAPAPGVKVYFLNADNSVVLSDVTDATGVARAEMVAGGSATAVNPFTTPLVPQGAAAPDELRTFVGVKPGDHLVLSHAEPVPSSFTLTAPASPNGVIQTQYDVVTTCGTGDLSFDGDSAPHGLETLADCGNTADIAVVATTPVQPEAPAGPTIEILFHPGAALPDPTDPDAALDLTGESYGETSSVAFTYLNAPDTSISALHWLIRAGNLGPFVVDLSGGSTGTSTLPAGAVVAGMTRAIVDTTLAPSGDAVGVHDVIDWGLAGSTYTLELDGLLLPDLLTRPVFDAATTRVTWTESTTGAAPDLASTAILVNRDGQRWHWEIVAPYKAGEISFPHLPVDTIDYNPTADDSVGPEPVMNAKLPGGYDVARPRFLNLRDRALINPFLSAPPDLTGFVNGSSGTAVLVQTQPLPVPPPGVRLRRAGSRRPAAAAVRRAR